MNSMECGFGRKRKGKRKGKRDRRTGKIRGKAD
jgi:hypothetical protein